MERRLTTILSADVVGYSRLMEKNETATLAALNHTRAQRSESKPLRFPFRELFDNQKQALLVHHVAVSGLPELVGQV